MGASRITNQNAEKALKKLGAKDETPKGGAHPIYAIYHDGKLIASTGLRHSSKPDIPVPHVKRNLQVNEHFILELAACTKYKPDYLRLRGLDFSEKKD
jgi:hypothetical protein